MITLDDLEPAEKILAELCKRPDPLPAALFSYGVLRLKRNDIAGYYDLLQVAKLNTSEASEALYYLYEYNDEHPELNAELVDLYENAQKRYDGLHAEMNEIK